MRTRLLFAGTLSLTLFSCGSNSEKSVVPPPPPPGKIWRVPTDVSTISAAADSAGLNDTILVAPGIYREHGIALKPGVCLRGNGSAASVILDAEGAGRHVSINGAGPAVTIENATFRNGHLEHVGEFPDYVGGAIYSRGESSLDVENCVFESNRAYRGGAIYANRVEGGILQFSSRLTVAGCMFSANVSGEGGAVSAAGDQTYTDCFFRGNQANGSGGAVDCTGSPIFTRCRFEENSAAFQGGGVKHMGSAATYDQCAWIRNRTPSILAGSGAGALYDGEGVTITSCQFIQNSSFYYAGAVRLASGAIRSTHFLRNIVQGNTARGGAVFRTGGSATGVLTIDRCTFYGDSTTSTIGAALYLDDGDLRMTKTIIAGCRHGSAIYCSEPTILNISCTNIWGCPGGDWSGHIEPFQATGGNLSLDPRFCAPEAGDLHLRPDSPCLDAPESCGPMGAFADGCQ